MNIYIYIYMGSREDQSTNRQRMGQFNFQMFRDSTLNSQINQLNGLNINITQIECKLLPDPLLNAFMQTNVNNIYRLNPTSSRLSSLDIFNRPEFKCILYSELNPRISSSSYTYPPAFNFITGSATYFNATYNGMQYGGYKFIAGNTTFTLSNSAQIYQIFLVGGGQNGSSPQFSGSLDGENLQIWGGNGGNGGGVLTVQNLLREIPGEQSTYTIPPLNFQNFTPNQTVISVTVGGPNTGDVTSLIIGSGINSKANFISNNTGPATSGTTSYQISTYSMASGGTAGNKRSGGPGVHGTYNKFTGKYYGGGGGGGGYGYTYNGNGDIPPPPNAYPGGPGGLGGGGGGGGGGAHKSAPNPANGGSGGGGGGVTSTLTGANGDSGASDGGFSANAIPTADSSQYGGGGGGGGSYNSGKSGACSGNGGGGGSNGGSGGSGFNAYILVSGNYNKEKIGGYGAGGGGGGGNYGGGGGGAGGNGNFKSSYGNPTLPSGKGGGGGGGVCLIIFRPGPIPTSSRTYPLRPGPTPY